MKTVHLLILCVAMSCLACTEKDSIVDRSLTGQLYFTHDGIAVCKGDGMAGLTESWPGNAQVTVAAYTGDGRLVDDWQITPSQSGIPLPLSDISAKDTYSWYGYYPGQVTDAGGNRTSLVEPMDILAEEPSYSFFGVQTDENLHQYYLLVSDPEIPNNTSGHLGNQNMTYTRDVQMHFKPMMALLRVHFRISEDYEGKGILSQWGVSGSQVWTSGKMDLKRGYLKPDRRNSEVKELVRAVKDDAVQLEAGSRWISDMVIHPVQFGDEGTFNLYAVVDGKRHEWPLKIVGLDEIAPGYFVELKYTVK